MNRSILALVSVLLMVPSCAPAPGGEPGGMSPRSARAAAEEGPTLDFMTLNIWHDQQDWPARLAVMLEGLREADPQVICLQEVLQNEGLPNQAETLARELGYTAHFVSWDSAGSVKRYGNAILTRTPILERGYRRLDPPNDFRVIAHARIAPAGDTLDVYCTHLHHTQEQPGIEIRTTQVLDALEYVDLTRGDGPVIFAGDFNAEAGSPELRPVMDRFGDAYGLIHGTGADTVTTLNTAKGHRFTRIDHVFFRSGQVVDLVPTAATVVLDEPSDDGVWATDHFGVQVRFRLLGQPTGMRGR